MCNNLLVNVSWLTKFREGNVNERLSVVIILYSETKVTSDRVLDKYFSPFRQKGLLGPYLYIFGSLRPWDSN